VGKFFVCFRNSRRAAYSGGGEKTFDKYLDCESFFNFEKIIIDKAKGWAMAGKDVVKYFPETKQWWWGVVDNYSESDDLYSVLYTDGDREDYFFDEIVRLVTIASPTV
jgi:hypothetical protein